jgi:hypothetical protein
MANPTDKQRVGVGGMVAPVNKPVQIVDRSRDPFSARDRRLHGGVLLVRPQEAGMTVNRSRSPPIDP